MPSIRRDLMKTLSFAGLHFGVAFTVAYALTGSVAVATGIGLIEPIVNTVAFYFHERAWRRVEGGEPGAHPASAAWRAPVEPGRGAGAPAPSVTASP